MKFAIFGDIHANLDAFEVALAHMKSQDCTHYVCLGDVVGYNANPSECLNLVREMGCPTVRGNHDHYVGFTEDLSGFHPVAAQAVDWTRNQLDEEQLQWLRDLPYDQKVEGFTIVHSTLDGPENWGYSFEKYDAEAHFNYQKTPVCFYGHTHVPIAFEKGDTIRFGTYRKIKIQSGKKYYINVGSIGQPRDGDPRLAYVSYDVLGNNIELHRLEYNIDAAAGKILAAGLPKKLADRLYRGR